MMRNIASFILSKPDNKTTFMSYLIKLINIALQKFKVIQPFAEMYFY